MQRESDKFKETFTIGVFLKTKIFHTLKLLKQGK